MLSLRIAPSLCLQWYQCSTDLLGDAVRPLFIQSHLDHDTQAFLKHSVDKSGWLFTQLYHSFMSTVLSPVVSRTSINGSANKTKNNHSY